MTKSYDFADDIAVSMSDHVATVEIRRPPNNFFDVGLIRTIGDALDALDADADCRAVILAAQGKHFCAGADFSRGVRPTAAGSEDDPKASNLYKNGVRLFRTQKPIIAAIQGAAIGGGLGLALVADLRVTCPEARFSANFTRLGFHPGFGLTVTLPRLVGPQKAALMFYTGRRLTGEEAYAIGLADVLVPAAEVRDAAIALAREIAESAPLAVTSTRHTVRRGLADAVDAATEREFVEQDWLRRTADFQEGIKAMAERRLPRFEGR